ncbi:MAG: hypothetical protein KKB02_14670 [Alphaproteobacteria bacterium]|nr:hypothetical protein [Alphaproteobacteria bacterium]
MIELISVAAFTKIEFFPYEPIPHIDCPNLKGKLSAQRTSTQVAANGRFPEGFSMRAAAQHWRPGGSGPR